MSKEKIFDLITQEETWRDYTAEEIAEAEAAQIKAVAKATEQAEKEAARQAVLTKLGLTAQDISALGL